MRRITSLRRNQCRYPVSGWRDEERSLSNEMPHARHLFCAAPTERANSYCPEHKALCYGGEPPDLEALFKVVGVTTHVVIEG
jgi:hypothetical protein